MVLASSTDDFGAFVYSYAPIHELTTPQPSPWSPSPEWLARKLNSNMQNILTHSRLVYNKWSARFISCWSVLLTFVQVSEGYMTWATVEVGVSTFPFEAVGSDPLVRRR